MEALIGAMTDEDMEDRAIFDEILTDTTQRAENNIQMYHACLQQLYQAAASVAKAVRLQRHPCARMLVCVDGALLLGRLDSGLVW